MPILSFEVQADYEKVIRLREEIDRLETTMRNFQPGNAQTSLRDLEAQLRTTRRELEGMVRAAAEAGSKIARSVEGALPQTKRAPREVVVKYKADTRDFHSKQEEMMQELDKSVAQLEKYGYSIDGIFKKLSSIAGFGLPFMGLVQLLQNIKNVRSEFQDMESSMQVFFGNEEKGSAFMKELEDYAYYNMFDFKDLVAASQQMIAYGQDVNQLTHNLDMLSNIATATHAPLMEMVGLFNRAKAIGFVDGKTMQSWATKGLVINDVLKEMGEKAKNGKVSFEQLQRVLEHVTGDGGMFHGIMDAQMNNISAEIGQLQDNTDLMMNEIGEKMQPVITKLVKSAAWIVEHWQSVAVTIGAAFVARKAFNMEDKYQDSQTQQAIQTETDKLNELRRARERAYDPDIEEKLNNGRMTRDKADELQTARDRVHEFGASDKTLKQLKAETEERLKASEYIQKEYDALKLLNEARAGEVEGRNLPQHNVRTLDDDLKAQVEENKVSEELAVKLQEQRNLHRDINTATASTLTFEEYQLKKITEENVENERRLKAAREYVGVKTAERNEAQRIVDLLKEKKELEEKRDLGITDEKDPRHFTSTDQEKLDYLEELTENINEETAAQKLNDKQKELSEALDQKQSAELCKKGGEYLALKAAEELEAAQQKKNRVVTVQSIATDTLAASSKKRDMVVLMLHTARMKAWNAVATFTKNVGKQCVTMWKALGAAVKTNPIGMAITTVMGLVSAIQWKKSATDDEEESAAAVSELGKATEESVRKVEGLYALMRTARQGSKAYNDAMKELTGTAKDYGVVITDENNKYKELIDNHDRLIALIKEEGRQKQIQKMIDNLGEKKDTYTDKMGDTFDDVISGSSDEAKEMADTFKGMMALDVADNLDKIREKFQQIDELNRKFNKNYSKRTFNTGDYYREYSQALEDDIAKLNGQIAALASSSTRAYAKGLHLDLKVSYSQSDIDKLEKYVKHINDCDTAMERLITSQDRAREAIDALRDTPAPDWKAMDTKDVAEKLQQATVAVRELNAQPLKPSADWTALSKALQESGKTKDSLLELNAVRTILHIDQSQLDAALVKMGQLNRYMVRFGDGTRGYATEGEMKRLDALAKRGTKGPDGKTLYRKEDMAEVNRIKGDVKRRSTMSIGGREVQLNREQAAMLNVMLQNPDLFDETGRRFDTSKMDKEQRRYYDIFIGAVKASDQARSLKAGGETAAAAKKDIIRRVGAADTDTQMSELMSELKAAQKEVSHKDDQALWDWYQSQIDALGEKQSRGAKNAAGQRGGSQRDPLLDKYNADKYAEQMQKERARMERDALQAEEDYRIGQMKDGTDKEIAVARNEAKKKRDALADNLDKQYETLKNQEQELWLKRNPTKKVYEWKQTKTDEEYRAQAKKDIAYGVTEKEIADEETQGVENALQKRSAAMRQYLAEFGTFQQKRQVLIEDFEDKIKEADTEGEKLTLAADLRNQLKEIDEEIRRFDWGPLFDDLQRMSSVALDELKNKLRQALDEGRMTPAQMEAAYAKIADIEAEQDKRGPQGLSFREMMTPEFIRNRRQQQEEWQKNKDLADDKLQKARRADQQARGDKDARQSAIAALMMMRGMSANGEVSSANAQDYINQLKDKGATEEEVQTFSKMLADLAASEEGAKDAADNLAKANNDAARASEKADKTFSETLDEVGAVMNQVGANMQSAAEFATDVFGENSPVAQGAASMADGMNAATAAVSDLASGNYIGAVGNTVKALGSFGEALGSFGLNGLFGVSDRYYQRDMQRLTASNQELTRAIENLNERMADAHLSEVPELYKTQIKYAKDNERNTREQLQRTGAINNKGFLGIGGKHSANAKIDSGLTASDWAQLSEITHESLRQASDLWRLTSSEMKDIADYAPVIFAKIKDYGSQGYQDLSAYLDDFVGLADRIDDLTDNYHALILNVSFDGVKDNFRSMLTDMESSTQDFADNFEQMMQSAVVNSLMSDKYNDLLEDWYGAFAEAMGDDMNIDAGEQRALRQQYDDIVEQATAERDAIKEAMGWDASPTQRASTRTLTGMTQDTAEAIEGRMTAIQIAVEGIRASEQTHTLSLSQMNDQLLQVMQQYNRYGVHYENIEDQIAKCYVELQGINENTRAVVKPIQAMQASLDLIKRNTDNL